MSDNSIQVSQTLLQHILNKANPKYQLIILLMADAGLRITEAIQLKIGHFDFTQRTLTIYDDSNNEKRRIALTERLFHAQIHYWNALPHKSPDQYLFPPAQVSKQKHLSRKMVYRRIKAYSEGKVTPSALRNYFLQKQEGIETALIPNDPSNSNIPPDQEPLDLTTKKPLFSWFFKSDKKVSLIPMPVGMTNFHIGRTSEIAQINDLSNKKVNTLILGPMGIGKSHLLDNFNKGKILRVDDFRYPKNVLGSILLELFDQNKDTIMENLLQVNDKNSLEKIATKESAKRLCELAIRATQPKEYTLVIDDLTDVTKIGVRMLEKLKNHFHIIAAARQIKIEFITCLSNFEKLELKPLNYEETLQFIQKISKPVQPKIEDYESYQNRIWESTLGIPLFILEMIERLNKETFIDHHTLSNIKHTASKSEIDFSVPLVVAVSSLLVLRYLGNELGQNAGAFRLLGGIALVVAFFSRRIFKALKRKYV